MREERAKLSKHAVAAKAMDYMLEPWDGFASERYGSTAFRGEDGRIRRTIYSTRLKKESVMRRVSWANPGRHRSSRKADVRGWLSLVYSVAEPNRMVSMNARTVGSRWNSAASLPRISTRAVRSPSVSGISRRRLVNLRSVFAWRSSAFRFVPANQGCSMGFRMRSTMGPSQVTTNVSMAALGDRGRGS